MKYLTRSLPGKNGQQGLSYSKPWINVRQVHEVAYEKRKYNRMKLWNEILKLPGSPVLAEKKARKFGDDVLNCFMDKVMKHLINSDDVFKWPLNLYHMKVMPREKRKGNHFRLIPTEQGLIHSKFVPYYVTIQLPMARLIVKANTFGRIWSKYTIDVDIDNALRRRKNAKAKMRVTRKGEKDGI